MVSECAVRGVEMDGDGRARRRANVPWPLACDRAPFIALRLARMRHCLRHD